MRDQKNHSGLTARLLSGAKNFVWQNDLPAHRTLPNTQAAVSAADPAPQPGAPSTQNGLAAELMTIVMNRPTAYSALADAVAALSSVPMDEPIRFASAFAVLQKTQQRTVEQIMQAIDVHLGILESEKARFGAQSAGVEANEVASRIREAQTLAESCAEADRQIAQLRADTEAQVRKMEDDKRAKQERAASLAREAEEKRQAIARRAGDFAAAVQAVETTLAADKSKLQQYLGGSTAPSRRTT